MVDEGFASPSVCVVEDSESYITSLLYEVSLSGDLHLFSVNKGSNFITSKKDTINPKLSNEKKGTTVVNDSKAIDFEVSEDRKSFASDKIFFSGGSSEVEVYNSFQAKVDGD